MKHGIENEPFVREAYKAKIGIKVIQLGLVVSRENPWLGYSPDGVILDENGKPNKLIEIKCPLAGKTKTASDIARSVKYLNTDLTFRKKNSYYAQIQLGMAI